MVACLSGELFVAFILSESDTLLQGSELVVRFFFSGAAASFDGHFTCIGCFLYGVAIAGAEDTRLHAPDT